VPLVPNGYANVLIPAQHVSSARSAAITFGVQNLGSFASPSAIAGAVWAAFEPTLLVALDSNVSWGPIVVTANFGGDPITGVGTDFASGGSAIDSIPGNGALLVQKLSLLGGRKNRGRYFIPWALQESDVDEVGVISLGTVSDHQDIQDDFLTALTTEDVPMVILHSGAGAPAGVAQLSVQGKIGTQRKRLRAA